MVPGMANLAPALFVRLQAAADGGAAAESAELQRQVTAIARIYQQGPWLAALKAACAMLGLGNGRPAPPLAPALPAARERIAALLEGGGAGAAPGATRRRAGPPPLRWAARARAPSPSGSRPRARG